jgi:murein hydrolase activator
MTEIICCYLINIFVNFSIFHNCHNFFYNFNLEVNNSFSILPNDDDLTLKFEKAKSHLIWPVDRANIISYFGVNQHPKYESVRINNDGITFSLVNNSLIKCVFEGKVIKVERIPGLNFTVICKHGEYFTVYSNLNNVKITCGEICKEKQIIGEVIGNFKNEKNLKMYFQIWHLKDKLNPMEWLKEKSN